MSDKRGGGITADDGVDKAYACYTSPVVQHSLPEVTYYLVLTFSPKERSGCCRFTEVKCMSFNSTLDSNNHSEYR